VKFGQMLGNRKPKLSNAIKFTPRGGKVQLRLSRVNSHVEVTVSDAQVAGHTSGSVKRDDVPTYGSPHRGAEGTRRHLRLQRVGLIFRRRLRIAPPPFELR
jgi:hypothetical protein